MNPARQCDVNKKISVFISAICGFEKSITSLRCGLNGIRVHQCHLWFYKNPKRY